MIVGPVDGVRRCHDALGTAGHGWVHLGTDRWRATYTGILKSLADVNAGCVRSKVNASVAGKTCLG